MHEYEPLTEATSGEKKGEKKKEQSRKINILDTGFLSPEGVNATHVCH